MDVPWRGAWPLPAEAVPAELFHPCTTSPLHDARPPPFVSSPWGSSSDAGRRHMIKLTPHNETDPTSYSTVTLTPHDTVPPPALRILHDLGGSERPGLGVFLRLSQRLGLHTNDAQQDGLDCRGRTRVSGSVHVAQSRLALGPDLPSPGLPTHYKGRDE